MFTFPRTHFDHLSRTSQAFDLLQNKKEKGKKYEEFHRRRMQNIHRDEVIKLFPWTQFLGRLETVLLRKPCLFAEEKKTT